jgi:hypothetical protein
MSASAVELGFLDDFWGPRVLVFVNSFWASSSLCTLKMSASAVELRFEDEFWERRESVSWPLFCQELSMCVVDVSVSRRTRHFGLFLGLRDLVFVKGFWGSSSLCRLKI